MEKIFEFEIAWDKKRSLFVAYNENMNIVATGVDVESAKNTFTDLCSSETSVNVKKKKVALDAIETCLKCRFCKSEKVYTGDSWEDVAKLTCTKSSGRIISPFYEDSEEIKIPKWCPLLK